MSKKSVPSLQDIAEHTGFGKSTISLALRNSPSLPEATRAKIRMAAETLGYRPNPLVKALMTQLRGQRRTRQERIALVCRRGQKMAPWRRPEIFYSVLYGAIKHHAAEQGFGLDEFHEGDNPVSDARLSRILLSRGIHGVLLFPGRDREGAGYPVLEWQHFATVLIGFNLTQGNLHQVMSDYVYDIDEALHRVEIAGLRRVGCAMPRPVNQSINHAWISRFLLYQYEMPEEDRVPLLFAAGDKFSEEELLSWYHRNRPEVILIAGEDVRVLLEKACIRIPEDVRLINLVQRGETGLAGIDPRTSEVGRAAVELLDSLLQANQLGQPEFPRTIAIKGHWSPGASFPE
ncbi:MAG: LacI family transcriptional regulator [Opitutaceae bacterium]|jgi:LacI family fructose operon transcriptional repressor|nr:LacI family transcriptional regulator [Opitutaceae bacterium]